jgi:tetratricopeptide (TPR) repeat protein/very-short-patch-repair endonuclease
MLDVNRAIAGNPQDWKAYRDRGWIHAHKHEFDRALADLDMALRLNPDDARAYTRRGHVWKAAGQRQKAIADYEAAMRHDPTNTDAYRDMIQKAQGGENANTTTSAASTSKPQITSAPASGLTGFFKRLAQYYAEFLSTDFKKQRLPRRRLQNADPQGRLVGIPLRKYPGFQQKLWADLAKPIGTGLSLTVARGSWRATLPKAVAEAIATHIAMVRQEDLDTVVTTVIEKVAKTAQRKSSDPDIAFEQFIEGARSALAKSVVGPLLDRMEGFFERTEHKPIESLRELEDQLSARLINGIESSSGAAFSRLLVKHEAGPLETVMNDQLNEAVVRGELEAFFASFNAGDLYVELSDLVRSSRLIDNVDFYLHIGEVRHAGHVFPIFYVPFTADRTEQGFSINAEPRLYVNKRAMDYVAQETARAEGRSTIASVLRERVFYLLPDQAPLGIAQKLFDEMAGGFNLRADIDFGEPREQKISSLLVTATNNLSFSLFDRSDESMVNDYEALLTGIDAGTDVIGFFSDLIDQFLLKNPISVRADVNKEWDDKPMPERLVFDSPLPLVEEQRKILSAIKHPDARFIAVEGPPGTGKSHTITAVAFDLILSGKSLLVLSDKKEALDVVEDKLNQALAKVRPTEDFPNPILRLGKDASNYAQLLKKSAIERLDVNQRVVRKGRSAREAALKSERETLMAALQKTANAYAAVDLSEIAKLEADIAGLIARKPEAAVILADQWSADLVHDFAVVAEYVRARTALAVILKHQGRQPARLSEIARIATVLGSCAVGAAELGPVTSFSRDRLHVLDAAIRQIEDMKVAVFGYLFAGKKLLNVSRLLHDKCKIECEKPQRELSKLKALRNNLQEILKHLSAENLEGEFGTAVFLIAAELAGIGRPTLVSPDVVAAARRLEEAMSLGSPLLAPAKGQFYAAMLGGTEGSLSLVSEMGALKLREQPIKARFVAVPKVDYVGTKGKIESLNTQALAEHIDERFIEFYDTKKNDALALGKIIREKKRFPIDKFGDIQRAFPCIIAGLRDYAEFIPLEREIFDLVIIDEASQVSIAQALPAIIRAKKVVVLGDRNQFGNVKTSNASQEVNVAFMQDLIKSFTEDYTDVSDAVRTKIDLFNIRSSVLDFVEPISNFAIQLKKHFRSYPEMISFSSRYFYGDSLQVMKIRGQPIEEVIEFDTIDHDGLIDQRNVNALEAKRIVERISQCLDRNPPPTVGVITPHTEQQAYIAKLVGEHPQSEEFYDKLRLKVMTFDTCQGEEREIIFYSLVATEEKDRLAYVFPSKLDRDQAEEVDHNLRLQRLNVGLSRGQEKIVFVHSKAPEKYASALRVALQHYRNELERAKSMPTEEDVDAASPMERKVLHWLGQVPLIRDLDGDCEILANFELGLYLKQLDPAYQHPEYRVDFLIRMSVGGRELQLVLEYDGFEYHFAKGIPSGIINSATWRAYLTEDDLEREKVLESFGYPMIRLNRFNLDKNPVATIDSMLRERLESMLNGNEPHDLVKRDAAKATEIEEGLKTGDYKRCKKCDRDLPVEFFRDGSTKSGLGRLCRECKATMPSTSSKPRFRRR